MPLHSGGVYEAASEKVDKDNELDLLVEKSRKIIFETKSVFPFELFPDKITICPNRVTITRNSLFSKFEYPIQIENITGARIYRTVFFATLYIDTFGIAAPDPIRFLKIDDARIARRYLLALIECKKANIDLSKYEIDELREKLKKIGKVREGK